MCSVCGRVAYIMVPTLILKDKHCLSDKYNQDIFIYQVIKEQNVSHSNDLEI